MTSAQQTAGRRRRRALQQDVVGATIDNFRHYELGGRSRDWLEKPIDPTRPPGEVVAEVLRFLGHEGRPISNLVVALEMVEGGPTQGQALLVVDASTRTRTARISWKARVVTGAGGEQVYLGAPHALRRLTVLLARDVVELALGAI